MLSKYIPVFTHIVIFHLYIILSDLAHIAADKISSACRHTHSFNSNIKCYLAMPSAFSFNVKSNT